MSLTYTLPENLTQEIDALERTIFLFKQKKINATEMKVRRVPFGVYEQRKHNTYMIRVRCAGAFIIPKQLQGLAELSSIYGASWLHVTSRQEIQLHYVELDGIIPVLRALQKIGLASRGGGGNTVRNIMAPEDAGIALDDVFDVSPYAIALTTRLIAESDSWNLPRKFKIAFSGSAQDRGYATINDIGFIAKMKDGKKGFCIYVAGGMGAKPMLGHRLFDFVPAAEVYNISKAIKNLFFKYGNRRNKHAARLRFLWTTLGEGTFRQLFNEEYAAVQDQNYPPLSLSPILNQAYKNINLPRIPISNESDFLLWQQRFVRTQRQYNLYAVTLPLPLGHIDNDEALLLSKFLDAFGDNVLRMTKDQNLLLRNIPQAYLTNLYLFFKKHFRNFNRPYIVDKMLACAGASTCQLGICLSPGATEATRQALLNSAIDLEIFHNVKINVSGCPNSCGQHHAADIGFFGKVARKGDRVYPAYNVVAGAMIHENSSEFAQKVGTISARNMPSFILDVFQGYALKSSQFDCFQDYIRSNEGRNDLKQLSDIYKDIPAFDQDKRFYYDWGSEEIFSLAQRGKGECSAGLFDLIEMDFGHITQARKLIHELNDMEESSQEQKVQLLNDIVFYAARVLLISQALEPHSSEEVYTQFNKTFIQTGLVDECYYKLITICQSSSPQDLLKNESLVYALAQRMEFLYHHMDNAFQFDTSLGPEQKPINDTSPTQEYLIKDLRQVTCPMNFVKTKMALAQLKINDVLEIWLDDGAPIENVPGSVQEEGHDILSQQKKTEGHWAVLIQKR